MDHRPVLNSPYEYPKQHWELDKQGQPTQQIIERRAFFCQMEAVETVIWLTEVAPTAGKVFLEHLVNANNNATRELLRLALKLATGAKTPRTMNQRWKPAGSPV